MSQTDRKILTVAGVPEHFNLPWHLAIEADEFESAGVQLLYRDYPGGTGAMTRALASQEVDLAVLLAEGAVADIVKRRQSKIVKVYVTSPLIWGIHVAEDSEIREVDQIRDRRYAISRRGSGSHLMAIVDASERGWETDDLDFEVVRNLDGARRALAEDEADIFLWEKFTTQPFVDNGEFRRVGLRETLWPAFVIVARNDVLENRAGDVTSVLKVINQSCKKLMTLPGSEKLIAQRYDLKVDEVQQWLELTRWSTDFIRPDRALQTIVDYLSRLEIIGSNDIEIESLWESLG